MNSRSIDRRYFPTDDSRVPRDGVLTRTSWAPFGALLALAANRTQWSQIGASVTDAGMLDVVVRHSDSPGLYTSAHLDEHAARGLLASLRTLLRTGDPATVRCTRADQSWSSVSLMQTPVRGAKATERWVTFTVQQSSDATLHGCTVPHRMATRVATLLEGAIAETFGVIQAEERRAA